MLSENKFSIILLSTICYYMSFLFTNRLHDISSTAQYLLTYTIDYCSTQSLHLLVLCEVVVVVMVGMTFTVADRAVWPILPSALKSRTDTR